MRRSFEPLESQYGVSEEFEDCSTAERMARRLGLSDAVLIGLGSILGTGAFFGISLATLHAGVWVVPAVMIAGLLAMCNGLSSAQLAARFPVSGGTYEYAYRVLHPTLGFTAGWMFLCAKGASAAAACTTLAAILGKLLAIEPSRGWAIAMLGLATLLVLQGIRRSNQANFWIVLLTVLALATFGLTCFFADWIPSVRPSPDETLPPPGSIKPDHIAAGAEWTLAGFCQATAILFVAYTGYGRIATMAEEVRTPRRTIPSAMIVTLAIAMFLYATVAVAALSAGGADRFGELAGSATPLPQLTRELGFPMAAGVISLGASVALLGVTLNLLLGLSRVTLAMARRGDLPSVLTAVDPKSGSPNRATLFVAGLITLPLVCCDLSTTWTFSAFTVLIYYALTNAAALRLPTPYRPYPRFIAWLGLLGCLSLAFWVDTSVWLMGLGLLAGGLAWHVVSQSWYRSQ